MLFADLCVSLVQLKYLQISGLPPPFFFIYHCHISTWVLSTVNIPKMFICKFFFCVCIDINSTSTWLQISFVQYSIIVMPARCSVTQVLNDHQYRSELRLIYSLIPEIVELPSFDTHYTSWNTSISKTIISSVICLYLWCHFNKYSVCTMNYFGKPKPFLKGWELIFVQTPLPKCNILIITK